ncbi:unnamed protein product [Rotaria sp. Silwood2]|nr:unnamed protein product [Rotaria sp. Silwood2]CAF3084930.1 unnamed protein product [Rotaria sp. Silwood2]CAF3399629.1 unnamed protein product [Rotaria sp. Silwood2]CAF4006540.1 unnamed protein product [Rotaria sp. Silwood2]CAF4126021.1 unnamed protein product [Rotaria sp. Silwood2]
MQLDIRLNEDDDVLLFWLQHQSKLPILASIVQKFYAIPASNTSAERLFSSSKSTISDRRTRLGTEKVNKLLFLQKNLQVLKKLDATTLNVALEVQVKRKTTEPSSSSISIQNQEQLMATAATKKFQMVEQDNIFICDDDIEEDKKKDEIDSF